MNGLALGVDRLGISLNCEAPEPMVIPRSAIEVGAWFESTDPSGVMQQVLRLLSSLDFRWPCTDVHTA